MKSVKIPSAEKMNELFVKACEDQNNGNLEGAKAKYLQLLEYVPGAPILLYNLGLVHFGQEAYVEAEMSFADALVQAPEDLDILFNLALSQKKNSKVKAAIQSYKKLLTLDPDSIDSLYNLGGCYKDSGLHGDAIEMYLRVLDQNESHISTQNNLAYVYQYLGETDKAIHHYRKVLEIKPDHSGANHMLSALTGTVCSSPPVSYVKEVFDGYSKIYEQSLVKDLEYCVPEEMLDLYTELQGQKSTFQHGLDLGCGTGLCGEKFVKQVTLLDGVDLSAKMIEQARAKNIYRHLDAENIADYLQRSKKRYDLFLAADVFGYVGELSDLFSLIKNRSTPDVLFGFSTETTKDQDFVLRPTGRFAHSTHYIAKIAVQTGWTIVANRESKLRKERGEWVGGTIWFLALQ